MKAPDFESSGLHRRLTFDLVDRPEAHRVYLFPGGDKITLAGVVGVKVSKHGGHMVETMDGTVHVIPWGWISLSFPAEASVCPEEEKRGDDE